jgi:thiamine biosynthesis lipoprotein
MTMPLVETLPIRPGTVQWSVWGTTARIVVTDPSAATAAAAIVRDEIAAVDAACSRFRPDSELMRLTRSTTISPLLTDLVAAALRAAEETDGDVDPTLGGALCALGYDRDLAEVRATSTMRPVVVPVADWRQIRLIGNELTVPAGVRLDLGATAKAWTADRCATVVAQRCGVGVLVSLGGDIATAGPAPDGGWQVLVQDGPDEPGALVALPSMAGLATSSTISRRWRNTEELLHHILDPATGRPVPRVWRTASVAASSCLRANTLSTAALVRGTRAARWLRSIDVPARLVAADGSVHPLGDWPVS